MSRDRHEQNARQPDFSVKSKNAGLPLKNLKNAAFSPTFRRVRGDHPGMIPGLRDKDWEQSKNSRTSKTSIKTLLYLQRLLHTEGRRYQDNRPHPTPHSIETKYNTHPTATEAI